MPEIPKSQRNVGLPRRVAVPQLPLSLADSGAASALGSVTDTLSKIGAIEARQREKSERLDRAARLSEARNAFNRTMDDMEQSAGDGAPEFTDNVRTAFGQSMNAAMQNIPESQRAAAEVEFGRYRETVENRAARFEGLERARKRTRDLTDALNLGVNAVRGDHELYEQVREGGLEAIEDAGLPPAIKDQIRRDYETRTAAAAVERVTDTDPEAAKALLESGQLDDELSPQRKSQLLRSVETEIRRRESQRKAAERAVQAEQRALQATLRNEISGVNDHMARGYQPRQDYLAALETQARALGDARSVARLDESRALLAFQTDARTWTPGDLQNWISAERGTVAKAGSRGISEFKADRLDMAEKLLTEMGTEIRRDQLSWAARVGLRRIEPLVLFDPPLPPDTPAEEDIGPPGTEPPSVAQLSIRGRVNDALAVANLYGIAPRFLTNEEAEQLRSMAGTASVDIQVNLLQSIGTNFGEFAPDVLAEIRLDKPIFAHAGGLLATGAGPETVRDALVGEKAMADGNPVLPAEKDRRQWTDEAIGGALAFSPSTRAAMIETAQAIYHTRAVRRAMTGTGEGNEGVWNRAMQEAAGATFDGGGKQFGGIQDYNGVKVVMPRYIEDGTLDTFIGRLTDEDLKTASVGGGAPSHDNEKPFTAAELQDAYLVAIGNGRYRVSRTNPESEGAAWIRGTGPHGHYVLDINTIAPDVLTRTTPAKRKSPISEEGYLGRGGG